jgi:hypothetical protein
VLAVTRLSLRDGAGATPLAVIFHGKFIGIYQEDGEVCEHLCVKITSYHIGHRGDTG